MKFMILKRNYRWLIKYLILAPLVVVVFLNVKLVNQVKETNNSMSKLLLLAGNDNKLPFSRLFNTNNSANQNNQTKTATNQSQTKFDYNREPTDNEINELRKLIFENNLNPKIRNKHFIADLLENEKNKKNEANISKTTNTSQLSATTTTLNETSSTKPTTTTKVYQAPKFFIILIQVHSRFNYLKALVESLKDTKYIEQTLVIFSHDIYDSQMNDLVASIDFCATLQIFYPYSLQLYPNKFPGKDPNDCPKSIGKAKAIIMNCNNAYHPDSFGNYREHNVVQIKHHWLWKLGYVFEQLNETREIDDLYVLLLEEDYYLLPDSIHVFRKLSEKILSDIDIVSLAIFDRLKQNLNMENLGLYSKGYWHSSKHNTGLSLARPQWKMIKDCLNAFCTYDDYNWDWTLQYVAQSCFKLQLVSIFPMSSRVVHVGECGTHHRGKNCDPKEKIDSIKQAYEQKKSKFFSDNFALNNVNTAIQSLKKSNGGWSDPRDHQLCKSFGSSFQREPNVTITIKT